MKLTNEIVISKAKALGFTLTGFAPAGLLLTESTRLKEWLASGYNAGMQYMEKNLDRREDIRKILPDAKSVISLGLNYYTDEQYNSAANTGKVSRYAWGKDYHLIMWEMLEKLISGLKEIEPDFEGVSYVDTGPVMDKAWAVKAGLGWMGKHSNIINKEIGSWFFIANIICNYEFKAAEIIADHCGSCTACIDACPTKAIVADYVIDANKCISYLTIENKGDIPGEFKDKMDQWIFGCDICQDVCPWNIKFAEPTFIKEFHPVNKEIDLSEIDIMDDKEFRERFAVSPIKRAKLKGLKRNSEFLKR